MRLPHVLLRARGGIFLFGLLLLDSGRLGCRCGGTESLRREGRINKSVQALHPKTSPPSFFLHPVGGWSVISSCLRDWCVKSVSAARCWHDVVQLAFITALFFPRGGLHFPDAFGHDARRTMTAWRRAQDGIRLSTRACVHCEPCSPALSLPSSRAETEPGSGSGRASEPEPEPGFLVTARTSSIAGCEIALFSSYFGQKALFCSLFSRCTELLQRSTLNMTKFSYHLRLFNSAPFSAKFPALCS